MRNKYKFVTLRDRPDLINPAAKWFHSKWSAPKEAYLECMNDYLEHRTELGWYLCLDGDKIVGGLGVIENDFHDRKDLSPNVCAVYTEPDYRCQGIAGHLLNWVVDDLSSKGITPVYLVTDHTGFYERYGWEFLCMIQCDGETNLSRMYIHRSEIRHFKEINTDILKTSFGEVEAQALYSIIKSEGDFVGFAQRFMYDGNHQVARNALWVLTKATDEELSGLQAIRNELIDLAMTTEHSAVRRLSLNIVERLKMDEDDVRTDFLDFCLEHMKDIEEFPGVQAVCMKLANRMCKFYPDLMDELKRTLQTMAIEYYKPAVKCVRNRILSGKLK